MKRKAGGGVEKSGGDPGTSRIVESSLGHVPHSTLQQHICCTSLWLGRKRSTLSGAAQPPYCRRQTDAGLLDRRTSNQLRPVEPTLP